MAVWSPSPRVIASLFVALAAVVVVVPAAAQNPPACVNCLPPYAVGVTPDSSPKGRAPSGTYTDTFTVQNVGANTDTYSFACLATGGVTCSTVNPTSATLSTWQTRAVSVTYTVGTSAGTLKLLASGANDVANDGGSYLISLPPAVTLVAPVLTSGGRAVVRTRQPLGRATFLPRGSPLDTTKTMLTWRTDTVTTLARASRGLVELEPDSARWLNLGDSAQLTVTACAQNGLCTTASRWAVLLNDQKPVLGFSGMPLEALGRQFGAPFGPGLAVSGAEVETGFGAPAYVSLGASRSAGLVYSTRQSYPRVLVPVDFELTWPAGTPDQVKLTLFDGPTRLDSLLVATPTCATGTARRCRAVLQGDFSASSFATPTRKWLTVEARVTSGQTTQIGTDSVEVVLVDRRATPYGSGWWPSGILKLVAAGSDRILVGPSGTAAVYRGNGDSLYISPPGDFTVLTNTGTGWQLSPRGSTAKLVFDVSGRLIQSIDQNGNQAVVGYNGATDQVTSLRDPLLKSITFAYDGNGKLSTITDPASRQSKVVINATTNQLTYDSTSSITSQPYTTSYAYTTYPGTGTVVLTTRIGVIADTTVVTYDSTFTRRPSQVTLPQVQDENGNAVKPVLAYTAYEREGYGALRSLDSVYVQLQDPRNNWTRSLLNRWGEARQTWDSLGVLGRATYTPEGFVQWAEGKVPDSSRVYSSYDGLRRLAKSYIVRAVGDTLRLDSLVYDANHRVIQRIDARGKIAQYAYDANGNVTQAITPNSDTTRFWYRTDGLLDSTWAPGNTKSRRFTWNSTWKNLAYVTDESGTVQERHTYDALGRDSLVDYKMRVRVTTDSTQWQWRRTQSYYSVANQVDSTLLLRTDTCADPCNTATWLPASDTLHTQRVGHRFDRAGRDSLRLNDRGKAVLYLYDRLGRLVSRRPWTDSMAVKDSFVYDVAGNLKKTVTRRGDMVTTNYDSRNRDTLTVIPGVGTLRKSFAGPADQVTRLWYDSPVDSIGGVNAEMRWGYDQRGRLRADTSYAGSVVEALSHTYDTYERPATLTDPVGAWTTRYETNRGYADTLLTPMGDTLTYAFDAQSRPSGPYLRSGSLLQQRTATWAETGTLDILEHRVTQAPAYTPLKYDRNYCDDCINPALAPVWTEQHGAGASVDSLRDSVTYDGWERVVGWRALKNGVVVDSASFEFDRMGNITRTVPRGGVSTYDATTDRLLSRPASGCGTSWTHTYDRAGNLIQAVCGSTTWVYGYDALNRLRSVRYNATLIARYGYDVLGRRIAKRVYSTLTGGTVAYTRFIYRGVHVAFEADSGGAVGLRYTYGLATDDVLAIRDAAGNHYYVVQDLLHSVRGLLKRDGTWVLSQRFGPYGAVIARDTNATGPGFGVRYGWTGREYDAETGWYYFRARYFDPAVRRFVQEDPIGYRAGANVYAYGEGGPLEGRDPSGLMMSYSIPVKETALPGDTCIGFFGDEYGCGGGGGAWYESMISAWDRLPPGERKAEYDRYLTAYEQQQEAGTYGQTLNSEDTKELSPTEFGAIYSATADVAALAQYRGDQDLQYTASLLSTLLSAGRIAVNNSLVTGNALATSYPNFRLMFINSGNFDKYMTLDALGSNLIAFNLVHEAMHFEFWNSRGGALRSSTWDECLMDARARAATGWDYRSGYTCPGWP